MHKYQDGEIGRDGQEQGGWEGGGGGSGDQEDEDEEYFDFDFQYDDLEAFLAEMFFRDAMRDGGRGGRGMQGLGERVAAMHEHNLRAEGRHGIGGMGPGMGPGYAAADAPGMSRKERRAETRSFKKRRARMKRTYGGRTRVNMSGSSPAPPRGGVGTTSDSAGAYSGGGGGSGSGPNEKERARRQAESAERAAEKAAEAAAEAALEEASVRLAADAVRREEEKAVAENTRKAKIAEAEIQREQDRKERVRVAMSRRCASCGW